LSVEKSPVVHSVDRRSNARKVRLSPSLQPGVREVRSRGAGRRARSETSASGQMSSTYEQRAPRQYQRSRSRRNRRRSDGCASVRARDCPGPELTGRSGDALTVKALVYASADAATSHVSFLHDASVKMSLEEMRWRHPRRCTRWRRGSTGSLDQSRLGSIRSGAHPIVDTTRGRVDSRVNLRMAQGSSDAYRKEDSEGCHRYTRPSTSLGRQHRHARLEDQGQREGRTLEEDSSITQETPSKREEPNVPRPSASAVHVPRVRSAYAKQRSEGWGNGDKSDGEWLKRAKR
jgi:hypothetical protein